METPAETSFWTFTTRLQALADNPGAAASYAESYLAAHAGNFPIVEGNTAHFIYEEQTAMIIGVGGEGPVQRPAQSAPRASLDTGAARLSLQLCRTSPGS
jgi:hypothetical protein